MSKLNGHAPPDALEELDEVIAELEGNAWDEVSEITETHIHLPPGTTLEADRTGRLRAVSNPDLEITKTDHGKPESMPAKGKLALAVLDRLPASWRGPVVIVALGIVGILTWRGGAALDWWR